MPFYTKKVDETLLTLETSATGLKSNEARTWLKYPTPQTTKDAISPFFRTV